MPLLITLFTGPLASILWKILGIIAIGTTLVILYNVHNANIAARALAEFNQKQLTVTLENQKKIAEQLSQIQKSADENAAILAADAEKIREAGKTIETFVDQQDKTVRDKLASPLLRETIKRLSE